MFYELEAEAMNGEIVKMEKYKGKVILIVNTASKWGFTPQLGGLQALYEKYEDKGLAILGFPCNQFKNQEPKSNEEIVNFCSDMFSVQFDLFKKIDVNGENALPLYQYLKDEKKGLFGRDIKWNFTKFLVDRDGNVIRRFAPAVEPVKMEKDIVKLLG